MQLPPDSPDWNGQLLFPEHNQRNGKRMNRNVLSIQWQEDVFEPVQQSDRMSWRLLGAAVNLAYEAGIFPDEPLVSFCLETWHIVRVHRTRKLLYLYVTQSAKPFVPAHMRMNQKTDRGTLGWPFG